METLNRDQLVFYNEVHSLYNENRFETIALRAAGGTGKTYLIKLLAQELSILVICPSNKACNLYDNSKAKVMTIHRFLQAQREINEEGEVKYPFKFPRNQSQKIICIDECSMVSTEMYTLIQTLANRRIIIYVGDENQLPSVDTPTFNVFDEIKKVFSLSRNMRVQNDDSLSDQYIQDYRNAAIMLRNKQQCKFKMLPISRKYKTKDEMVDMWTNECIILTYTRAMRSYYNKYMHEHVYRKTNPTADFIPKYVVGELLIFNSGRRVINNEQTIFTSHILEIHEIKHCTLEFTHKTCLCGSYKKCIKCNINGIRKETFLVDFFEIIDDQGIQWFIPKEDTDLIKYFSRWKKVILNIKNKTRRNSEWVDFYDEKLKYTPDLQRVYSLTTHKAQGSEFNYVFVDVYNMRILREDPYTYYRLMYTALTRMRVNFYFIKPENHS